MPTAVYLGTKAEAAAAQNPPPPAPGIYRLRVTSVTEAPVQAHPEVTRVQLLCRVVYDLAGQVASGNATWLFFAVPQGMRDDPAINERFDPLQAIRTIRNAVAVFAGLTGDLLAAREAEGKSLETSLQFEDWKGLEVWAQVGVRARVRDGVELHEGVVSRFLTDDEAAAQMPASATSASAARPAAPAARPAAPAAPAARPAAPAARPAAPAARPAAPAARPAAPAARSAGQMPTPREAAASIEDEPVEMDDAPYEDEPLPLPTQAPGGRGGGGRGAAPTGRVARGRG